jgi:hypothetical protein
VFCEIVTPLGFKIRWSDPQFLRGEMILTIDIGGTKLSMAVFDGERMILRESRATDPAGGRD